MKKTKLWGLASILAAGSLLFGLIGCDTGNDEYLIENPTTTKSLGDDAYAGAVWDFASGAEIGGTAVSSETVYTGEVKQTTASTKATLTATNFKGKTNTEVLQFSKGTLTISDLSACYYLTLNLNDDSNIYIKAKGAGAAEAARLVAIADSSDTLLVYKDNLASTKDVEFKVQGAPAGEYKIYVNGSSIYKIDLSNAETFSAAKGYSSNDDLTLSTTANLTETFEAQVSSLAFTLADSEGDVTADAVWSSTNENVLTVKAGKVTTVGAGKAKVRARIGRFYKESDEITVTPCTKQIATFFAVDNAPSATIVLDVDWTADSVKAVADKLLTPVVVGNSYATISAATISFSLPGDVASWGDKPTALKKADADGSAYNKCAVYWKDSGKNSADEDINGTTMTADTTVATLTFKVTPKSGNVKLAALSGISKAGRNYSVKLSAGSESKTLNDIKTAGGISLDLENISISSETTVKVEFFIPSGKKSASSIGVQDLALYISN